MDFLRNLWSVIRSSEWYWQLPPWLREPPGLWIAAAILALVPLALAWWVLARRRRDPGHRAREKVTRRESRQALRREIRECRRRGDHLGAGQRYESLGKTRAALAAYRRGGCHAARADLLARRGRTAKARAAAEEGGEWSLCAELAEAEGALAAAGEAYERAGRAYAAAGCYERAGMSGEAAHSYLEAGMDAKAIELLMAGDDAGTAESLEAAIRYSRREAGPGPLEPAMEAAVRRGAQLWLEAGDAERAWRLAADCEAWEVALPIARDHLPPSIEGAEGCARAGSHLAAAEIYRQLGDSRREALERAEHFLERENAAESARWYEVAEEWDLAAEQRAACGDTVGAAELFARSGDFHLAARLYEEAGEIDKSRQLLSRATAHDRPGVPVADSPRSTGGRLADTLPAAETPGRSDRYVLRDEIGRGGMGVVYRADDLLLKRAVACKILSPDRIAAAGAEHLLAEARAAARLSHPNIVQVYDAGRDQNGFFIVMELVAGDDFARLLERRKLSLRGAVLVGRQICSALAHAHERRIIHRDLKPSNLIWTTEKRVKLTDFGLARAFEDTEGKVLTRAAGTPYYMAPEQIRGEPVDPRTDLYSLGCVLYELVTRRGPFAGGSSIHHHLNSRPDDPRDLRRDVPRDLAELILRCLEKEPARRPQTAREVGRALAAVQAGTTGPPHSR